MKAIVPAKNLTLAIEKKLMQDLDKNLANAGITAAGVEIPVEDLMHSWPDIHDKAGFSGMGRLLKAKGTSWFARLGRRGRLNIRKRNGRLVALVSKSDVKAAARPWVRAKAAKMAQAVKQSTRKIARVAEPTAAQGAVLPARAITRMQRELYKDVVSAIPECAVEGGMFGIDTFLTPARLKRVGQVSGTAIGGISAGPEEVSDAPDIDMDEMSGFGDDIERGAAVFGDDIERGAAAFDDFITASEVGDAATVSGFGDDIDAGASAFDGGMGDDIDTAAQAFDGGLGSDIERGASAFDGLGDDIESGAQAFDGLGDDITRGASAFDDFITEDEVEDAATVAQFLVERNVQEAGTVSGLGRGVWTGPLPGATRAIWSDTFFQDPSQDWSDIVYPRGGVVEATQRPPTARNTAVVAKKTIWQMIKKFNQTGSIAKAEVVAAKSGVKNPKRKGVGRPRTAGEAAFKPVHRGFTAYLNAAARRSGAKGSKARKAIRSVKARKPFASRFARRAPRRGIWARLRAATARRRAAAPATKAARKWTSRGRVVKRLSGVAGAMGVSGLEGPSIDGGLF
jgi:hypothetical protein